MDARFMQMHNFVLTREIIINSIFPVDRMRELNFHRETAVGAPIGFSFGGNIINTRVYVTVAVKYLYLNFLWYLRL